MSRKESRRTPVVPAEKEEASADSDASDEETNDGVVSLSHSSCSDKSMSEVASDSEESVEAADDFEYDVLKVLDEKTVDGIQSFYVKWKDGPGPVKPGTPKGQPNWHEWSLDIHDTWTEDAHKYMDLVAEFRERRAKELEETSKKMERSVPIAPKPSENVQTPKRVESRERQAVKTNDNDAKDGRSLRSSSKTEEKTARGSQQPAEEQTPNENPKRGDISTYSRRSGRVKNTAESQNEMPSTSADLPTTSTSVSPLNPVTLLDVKQEPGMEQEKRKKKKEKQPASAMTMDWQKVQQSREDKEMHKKRTKFASTKDKKKNATGAYPRQKPQKRARSNNSNDSDDWNDSGASDWDVANQDQPASIPDPTQPVRPITDLGSLFQNVKMEETGSPSKSNSNLYLNIRKENDEDANRIDCAQANSAENNPDEAVDSENDEDDDNEINTSDEESESEDEEVYDTIVCVPQDESGYAKGYTGRIVGHKTMQEDGAEKPNTFLRVVFRALNCSHWIRWDHVKEADELGFRDYLKWINEKEERKKNKELARIYDEKHAAYLARITAETAELNLEEAQVAV